MPVALQVLPAGLVVPPLPYLAGLLVALAVVGGVLWTQHPPVTQRLIVALAPWMVTGAASHARYQLGGVPPALAPLASAPTVYLSTAVLAGATWAVLVRAAEDRISEWLGGAGLLAAVLASGFVLRTGLARGTLSLTLPGLGLVVSVCLAGGVYKLLDYLRPAVTATTGSLGALVVFGHVLDGISTAIGVDLLGAGERSPIPRAIMHVAGSLPTASALGTGWLFVLVKLAVAIGVVVLFAEFVEEDPVQGNTLLGVVAAVGLGPGAHNLLLFAAAGPA